MSKTLRVFFLLVILTVASTLVALPKDFSVPLPKNDQLAQISVLRNYFSGDQSLTISRPKIDFSLFGKEISNNVDLKEGLDIQGGTQVVLSADMKDVPAEDRDTALSSAKEVIQRRVDLFGVSEPVVQTSKTGNDYRIIVELAGIKDTSQALQLIGTTAQLDFRLQDASPSAQATISATAFFDQFHQTGLTGKQLKRSSVQFDQKTGEPSVSLEFNDEGKQIFAEITKNNVGKVLGIFLDGYPVTLPRINSAILDGQAIISGSFTVDQAKQLSIQLNAGALPVPITVLQQQTIGASLGQESVTQSMRAGFIGLGLIILFMVVYYGWKGFLASLSLLCYAIYTVAVYKVFGVTLTLPGIAGLLLSIGMAVDANILIFERMKEELRAEKPFKQAMELGFGRAWNSIKDANLTTIFISLVLINPLDFEFLNRSGLVKGFGLTLLIGVLISLFTSMIVTRTLMTLFLQEPQAKERKMKSLERTGKKHV